jgi:hypothetical protein
VGKVLGLPEDVTAALAGLVWGWSRDGVGEKEVAALGLNLQDRRLRLTLTSPASSSTRRATCRSIRAASC